MMLVADWQEKMIAKRKARLARREAALDARIFLLRIRFPDA